MAVSLVDLKAKRTQAVAPRSLFGTVIEVANEEDVERAKALPVPQRRTKPDKLANFMDPDAALIMKNEREELERQIHKSRFAENNYKEAADYALTFRPNPDTIMSGIPDGALTYKPKRHYAPYKHDIKLHSRDIALSEHFNKLGLDNNPDYNYERYRRPYTHGQYQLAGTVLGRGGSFKQKNNPQLLRQSFPPTRRRTRKSRNPDFAPDQRAFPSDPIPDNLRFIHGEELCKEVTDDELAMLLRKPSPQPKRIPGPLITAKFPPVKTNIPVDRDPMYDALGNALKQDIFNGVPHSHVKSLYKSSFTQDPHDRTVPSFPPKFAILKNNDSKWNEDGVIRQRLYKAWDAMMLERKQEKSGGG